MTSEIVTLESVSDKIDYGLTASATQIKTGVKFLRITDIQDAGVKWSTVPYCECSDADAKRFSLGKGDILFARTGSVGKSYLIDALPQSAVFASYLIRVRPNQEMVYPQFLAYFFRSRDYWRQITETAVGGIQLGVNATKLSELRVPLLPLLEQRRIAGILDRADRLRRMRRYAGQMSEAFLQAVFVRMFGDATQFDLVKFEELLLEDPKNGLYLPSENYGQGTPIIRIDAFYNGILGDPGYFKRVKASEKDIEEFSVENGDILINRVNSMEYLGKCALVKGLAERTLFESNMIRIRVDKRMVLPIYLTSYLSSIKARAQVLANAKKAVNQASINQADVKSLTIPLPPLALQQQFARVVQQFERLRAQQREAERQAEQLFQALLQRAFGGEL